MALHQGRCCRNSGLHWLLSRSITGVSGRRSDGGNWGSISRNTGPRAWWGAGRLRQWEMQCVGVFLAESRRAKANGCGSMGMVRDRGWEQPVPVPALAFLSGCRTAVGFCRSGAAAASPNTFRTESTRVVNDRPSTLQGLISSIASAQGKRCCRRRDAGGRRLRAVL